MPDIPLLSIDEGILMFNKITILEWTCYTKPNPPQCEDPEGMSVTKVSKSERGTSTFGECWCQPLPCARP